MFFIFIGVLRLRPNVCSDPDGSLSVILQIRGQNHSADATLEQQKAPFTSICVTQPTFTAVLYGSTWIGQLQLVHAPWRSDRLLPNHNHRCRCLLRALEKKWTTLLPSHVLMLSSEQATRQIHFNLLIAWRCVSHLKVLVITSALALPIISTVRFERMRYQRPPASVEPSGIASATAIAILSSLFLTQRQRGIDNSCSWA